MKELETIESLLTLNILLSVITLVLVIIALLQGRYQKKLLEDIDFDLATSTSLSMSFDDEDEDDDSENWKYGLDPNDESEDLT